MHMIGVSSIDCCTADFSTRGQVRSWLFVSYASILRTLRAIFLSNAARALILKQTELTDEVFSNPSALPISLCLCPPTLRHKYIAIDRASFCSPRRFLLNSSKGLPYALAVTRAICSTPNPNTLPKYLSSNFNPLEPAETIVTSKAKSPANDDEADVDAHKGIFDQLKEDFGRKILNPFSW